MTIKTANTKRKAGAKARNNRRASTKEKAVGRPLNWDKIEATFEDLLAKTILAFAKKHADERFYALFIDFTDDDWTHVRLHLNTPESLRALAEEFIRGNPEMYSRRSIESVANSIRWEPGDFAYFEINNTRSWKSNWRPIGAKIAKAAAKQNPAVYVTGDFIELQFLLMVTRVLLRIERDGGLDCLKKTRKFRTCCMRPEERAEDAWMRMRLLRFQTSIP